MKAWVRYTVAVMVLVDEHADTIEQVVMIPGGRDVDRDSAGRMLAYTEQLDPLSTDRQPATHALYVADHDPWPDPSEWEIEPDFDALHARVDEQLHPPCPDCGGEGHTYPETAAPDADGVPCERCATHGFIKRDLGRHPDAAPPPAGR